MSYDNKAHSTQPTIMYVCSRLREALQIGHCLSVCLSVCPSVCPCDCLSVCLVVCLVPASNSKTQNIVESANLAEIGGKIMWSEVKVTWSRNAD